MIKAVAGAAVVLGVLTSTVQAQKQRHCTGRVCTEMLLPPFTMTPKEQKEFLGILKGPKPSKPCALATFHYMQALGPHALDYRISYKSREVKNTIEGCATYKDKIHKGAPKAVGDMTLLDVMCGPCGRMSAEHRAAVVGNHRRWTKMMERAMQRAYREAQRNQSQ